MKKMFSTRGLSMTNKLFGFMKNILFKKTTTKKFWKFVKKDGYSPGEYKVIKYIPGETVEVKDADPDPKIQCSSGIHCLDFSDGMYDDFNITFGPKVAILEVDEKDILYYKEGGKCRVKKAKVLEVKEPELWMRTGNGNSLWALYCAHICGHHPNVMQVILNKQNASEAYSYAHLILKGHDERLMQTIINSGDSYYSYHYALDVLLGHDERLMQVIIDKQDVSSAYLYAKYVLQGHNEQLMKVILDGQYPEFAYCYALDVLRGHDERLMQIIIDQKNSYYACDYAFNILKGHEERLMQIIIDQKNSYCAYCYAKNVLQRHDDKLMEIVQKDSSCKDNYVKYILNKELNND